MENSFIPEVAFIINIRSLWIVFLNGQAYILFPFYISKWFLLNCVIVLGHGQYALGEQGYKMSLQSNSKVTEKYIFKWLWNSYCLGHNEIVILIRLERINVPKHPLEWRSWRSLLRLTPRKSFTCGERFSFPRPGSRARCKCTSGFILWLPVGMARDWFWGW